MPKIQKLKYKVDYLFGTWCMIRRRTNHKIKHYHRPNIDNWVEVVTSSLRPNLDIPKLVIQVVPYLTNQELKELKSKLVNKLPESVTDVELWHLSPKRNYAKIN